MQSKKWGPQMTKFFTTAAILVSLLALNTTADAGPMSGATTGAQPTIPTTSERAAKSRYQSGYLAMKRYQNRMRQQAAQDKLGNNEIQNQMSDYNQAETLASSVQKKKDATSSAITGKIR